MNIKVVRVGSRKRSNAVRKFIGRPSELGNPFKIGRDGTRREVIEKYQRWLSKQMEVDGRVKKEMGWLLVWAEHTEVLELECYCAPRACHGDVIKRVLEQLSAEKALKD